MVDIFDEVNEDLRAERARQWFKRYGGVLVAVVLLIVGAVAGWQAWRWWEARRDLAVASQYLSAMFQADRIGPDGKGRQEAIQAFEAVAATAPKGYATLARLRIAALQADAGDLKSATAQWDQIAGDGGADPLLRDFASLMWVEHQIDTGDPGLLAARLTPLTAPGNPWRPLAQEAQGLIFLRTGKTDAAKALFQQLAQDATAPEGVRNRANGLLAQLGG